MSSNAGTRLLLLSPVRNEADHIGRVAASLASQTRPPDLWVVIDDGSQDGTLDELLRLENEIPFLRVLRSSAANGAAARDRLAAAADAQAFNEALSTVDWREFTHVGKFDGDIEVPRDYFSRLLDEFRRNPRLGIAGGRLVERFGSRWRQIRIPGDYHVHGALKLYRRECFEAVGGVREQLGWDTIDETYARMRGYETRSFASLIGIHHRHMATADGALRGRARHGRHFYIVRFGLPWVLFRSLKVAAEKPVGLSGLAFLYGYLTARVTGAPRVEDPDFKRFVRRELRQRAARRLSPRALVRGPLTSRGRQRLPKEA